MSSRLTVRFGTLALKNPLVAAAGDHLIDSAGAQAAIEAGAGAVILKSYGLAVATSPAYLALSPDWKPAPWGYGAPGDITVATRAAAEILSLDAWVDQCAGLARSARERDCLLVPSLALPGCREPETALKRLADAGLKAVEIRFCSEAPDAALETLLTRLQAGNNGLALWLKPVGRPLPNPDRMPLAACARADGLVVGGRFTGYLPDLESLSPHLGSSMELSGFWHLPLTAHAIQDIRTSLAGVPVIGVGGVRDGQDVARLLLSGADAVGIASSVMLRGYQVIGECLRQLDAFLATRSLDAAALTRLGSQPPPQTPAPHGDWRQFMPLP